MFEHFVSLCSGRLNFLKLSFNDYQGFSGVPNTKYADQKKYERKNPIEAIHPIFCDVGAHIEWFDRRNGYWVVLLLLVASASL